MGGLIVNPAAVPASVFVALLAAGYFGLAAERLRRALATWRSEGVSRALAGAVVILSLCLAYAAAARLGVGRRALAYAVYLLTPAALLAAGPTPRGRPPARELAAAVALWLPLEFHLLPALSLAPLVRFDALKLVALVEAMYLYLVVTPIGGVGYTFALRRRDVATAAAVFAVYAVVALPVGLATGFLRWHPRLDTPTVMATPLLVYVATAVPEEFLFRGLLQNLLARWLGARAALAVTAIVFGLAHLPDPRYVLLATVAGVAYGWVYLRTGKVTASAITHALVDAVWVVMLRA